MSRRLFDEADVYEQRKRDQPLSYIGRPLSNRLAGLMNKDELVDWRTGCDWVSRADESQTCASVSAKKESQSTDETNKSW